MMQKNAAKAFEQIATPMGALGKSHSFSFHYSADITKLHIIYVVLSESSCGVDCYNVWSSMIQGPLVPMLQSTSGILAAAAADCIAAITCSTFQKLPVRNRHFFSLTSFISWSSIM